MVKVEKLVKKQASSQGKVEFFSSKNGSSFELPP